MVTDGPPMAETLSITSGYSVPCARNSTPPILCASSSNTSIKVAPIALRFCSGSVTPASLARNSSLASRAQTITVNTAGDMSSLVGMPFDVPIVADWTGRPDRLGSFSLTLRWDPAVLRFDGGTSGSFGSIQANTDSAAQGVLKIAGANPAGVVGTMTLGIGRFTPLTAATTAVALDVSALFCRAGCAENRGRDPGRRRRHDDARHRSLHAAPRGDHARRARRERAVLRRARLHQPGVRRHDQRRSVLPGARLLGRSRRRPHGGLA